MCVLARRFSERGERCSGALPDHDPGLRSQSLQQAQHRGFCHRNAAGGRPEIVTRQMQEYRAAEAGYARRSIVINLDDEIVEMVIAGEPVAFITATEP